MPGFRARTRTLPDSSLPWATRTRPWRIHGSSPGSKKNLVGYTQSMTENSSFDLDGRAFVMVSSSASAVDSQSPTRFTYHQHGELIWGDYVGDTVTQGRFVGALHGEQVDISFAHELVADLTVVRGQATSTIEWREGRLYLVEKFAIDGVEHESVCAEV